jgi:hypothetical protein
MSKQQTSALALTTTSSVPDAISVINQKIADLKHIQESVYLTSGKVNGANGQIDLKELKTVPEIVRTLSSILARAAAEESAYAAVGYTTHPVVKVDGGTVDEWTADAKLRIAIIEQKETLDKLQGFKSKWEELMDKEDRKAMLLKEMEALAND